MILVIIGHAIQCLLQEECNDNHVWNLIYSFHMPAFMAVSGWLAFRSKSKPQMSNWGGYLRASKRRGMQLLVPYFAWSIIQFFMSGNYTLHNLSNMIFYPDEYLWFLWVLFWICVLFNLAQTISQRFRVNEILAIGGLCALLLIVMVCAEFRMFGFQFLAYYFLFYTMGYILHKYETSAIINTLKLRSILVSLTILWFLLAWGWTMHGLPSWMPVIPHVPSSLLQYVYRGLTAMVAIIVLQSAAPQLLKSKGIVNGFMAGVGIISLGMYTGHLFFLGHVKNWFVDVYPVTNIWIAILVVGLLCFALSYFLVRVLGKYRLTSMIFLGKIKK